jgi:hypothetical protein
MTDAPTAEKLSDVCRIIQIDLRLKAPVIVESERPLVIVIEIPDPPGKLRYEGGPEILEDIVDYTAGEFANHITQMARALIERRKEKQCAEKSLP